MTVLVTGGAGYIGSHICHRLTDSGTSAVVIDDLSTGIREAVPSSVPFVRGNIGDEPLVTRVLTDHRVHAVIHLAGSIVVEESVREPLMYYRNNVGTSEALVRACLECDVSRFLFSSSAAVYGAPKQVPVSESAELSPINPYGRSKLMVEWLLQDVAAAQRSKGRLFQHACLRYFNVAGADPVGRVGQSTKNATHLIKIASEAAIGRRSSVSVFGSDYPTPDGTCIRDYIHVSDLADIHVAALDQMDRLSGFDAINCGYGHGYSVREVLDAVSRHAERPLEISQAPRRAGDPAQLVADTSLLREKLDWTPSHDNLDEIIQSALAWERRLNA